MISLTTIVITKGAYLNRQFRDLCQSEIDTQMVPQCLAPEGEGGVMIRFMW